MLRLNKAEEGLIYTLAEKLVGVSQEGDYKTDILISNVVHRINTLKLKSLKEYLLLTQKNDTEFKNLISLLTIHTTSWFREKPHFDVLKKYILENIETYKKRPFNFLSAACSSGEEVYSVAMVLEEIRIVNEGFDYQEYGFDIDSISVETGKRGIYFNKDITELETKYLSFIRKGKGNGAGCFKIVDNILRRCHLKTGSILELSTLYPAVDFDFIFCRNVLIYFSADKVSQIIDHLKKVLKDGGVFSLGHCEAIFDNNDQYLNFIGNSSYRYKKLEISSNPKQKVLVIDDSPTIRKVYEKALLKNNYHVLTAENANKADKILSEDRSISLITLDLNMPGESGTQWLKRKRSEGLKLPVVIISETSDSDGEEVICALEKNAQGFFNKNEISKNPKELFITIDSLLDKRNFLHKKSPTIVKKNKKLEKKVKAPEIILLGASTGGTEALARFLKNFDSHCPPIVIVQHIPASFSKAFARRLSQVSSLELGNMNHGSILERGKIYIADGDYHISVKRVGEKYKLQRSVDELNNGHRPSVSTLFASALGHADKVCAFIFTGMGKDGALEIKKIHDLGGMTFAQDADSSVVYGMPREAVKNSPETIVGNIEELRSYCDELISRVEV